MYILNKNTALSLRLNTTYGVRILRLKILNNSFKKSLTQAFSRHIIGVASEQKKCTEAKNEQKQKLEQKTPHKTTVPRRRSFFNTLFNSINTGFRIVTKKKPDHKVGYFLWWSWRVLPPRPNGNLLLVYKLSLFQALLRIMILRNKQR